MEIIPSTVCRSWEVAIIKDDLVKVELEANPVAWQMAGSTTLGILGCGSK